MGKTTKIDWCDSTWNPCIGCNHSCNYCYAKRIAERFAGFKDDDRNRRRFMVTGNKDGNIYEVTSPMDRETKSGEMQHAPYPFSFSPTFHVYRLEEPQAWKEPKDIFVCSMADLFGDFIPDEWIQRVFKACEKALQHRYFFLTKNPKRYIDLFNNGLVPKEHDNFWFGTSVPTPETEYFFRDDANCFLSIEPIHDDFPVDDKPLKDMGIKWIIVGAETGNRVGKVKPEFDWIQHIAEICKLNDIPLFMKGSVCSLMGTWFKQEKP